MAQKKNILLLTTGGTIASLPGGEGLEPHRSDVMERQLEQLRSYFDITVEDLMCLDSSNIRPEEWQLIAREIFENRVGFDGVVVSHGTDTMAYTASAVTFMLPDIDLPVVFTGSQLPLADMLSDGPDNLRTAFAMAAEGHPGVFLAFDRKVMLGCRAVKVRASGFSAFESINARYAGLVSNRGLEIDESVIPVRTGEARLCTDMSKNVFLLKLTLCVCPLLGSIDLRLIILISLTDHAAIGVFQFGQSLLFVRLDFAESLIIVIYIVVVSGHLLTSLCSRQ